VVKEKSRDLRGAIENLMTVKLLDILAKPNRLDRLNFQRSTSGASEPIRLAERQLDEALSSTLVESKPVRCRKTRTGFRGKMPIP
jgi:hypothetical protein